MSRENLLEEEIILLNPNEVKGKDEREVGQNNQNVIFFENNNNITNILPKDFEIEKINLLPETLNNSHNNSQELRNRKPKKQPDIKRSKLHDINTAKRKQRSACDMLLWGAIFGATFTLSQIALYALLAKESKEGVSKEFDKLSFIPNAGGTFLSFLIYTTAVSATTAIINLVHKKYFSTNPTNGKVFSENNEPHDINELFRQITRKNRPLKMSTQNWLIFSGALATFAIFNVIYCFAYLDIAGEAIKLLPNYISVLNANAGYISFTMNLLLNQWFAVLMFKSLLNTYKALKQIRKNFSRENGANSCNVIKNFGIISVISAISSLSFFFLTLTDSKLSKHGGKAGKIIAEVGSFVIYLTLNASGTIGLLNNAKRFWSWLVTMPKPLINAHEELKKEKYYGLHLLGYVIYNFAEFTKESAFLLSFGNCNKAYANNNDLGLSKENDKPVNKQQKSNVTLAELKAAVEKAIYQLDSERLRDKTLIELSTTLKSLITENVKKLQGPKPITPRTYIWRNGRLRNLVLKAVTLGGTVSFLMILTAYYFLVNEQLTKKIYNFLLHMGLEETDAGARLLSVYFFLPFISLVLDAGGDVVKEIFDGCEHKIMEIRNSLSVLFLSDNKTTDFDFEDRFHPRFDSKEISLWLINGSAFAMKLVSFAVAWVTAATVYKLLNDHSLLNTTTGILANIASVLFNGMGAVKFIDAGKEALTRRLNGKTKLTLFRLNDEFMATLENHNGCQFDINKLKLKNHATKQNGVEKQNSDKNMPKKYGSYDNTILQDKSHDNITLEDNSDDNITLKNSSDDNISLEDNSNDTNTTSGLLTFDF